MKKLSLSFLAILLVMGTAGAQQEENHKVVRQQVAEDVPQAVLEAVEKNHEGFQFQEEETVPRTRKKQSRKNYLADIRSNSSSGKTYSMNKTYYKADGTVISSRIDLRNCALPKTALRTIGKEFNGWLLVRTKSVVEIEGDTNLVYYKAVLKNGNKKAHVLLNEDGQIVKNKRELKEDAFKAHEEIVLN
ncbi:hypothetical protein D770_18470 [Flammeovirgaceae bacterium 311]|nr:hypothetical protein D770_18470 [Flammeovirgaceae bacterium 311]